MTLVIYSFIHQIVSWPSNFSQRDPYAVMEIFGFPKQLKKVSMMFG